MPDRHNSLADAVSDAMTRHQRGRDDPKDARKKHSVIERIAAQVERSKNAPSVGGAPSRHDGK